MGVPSEFDVVLVGGGLQNGLIALALLYHRPGCRIAMIERGERIGGNHLWCFHAGDVPAEQRAWVDPLVRVRWPSYRVHFPELERRLEHEYAAVPSEQLRDVVETALERAPGCQLALSTEATSIARDHVVCGDGSRFDAPLVVDARGPDRLTTAGAVAYQKFVGLELELSSPCPIETPIVMDARVPQSDGFRFVYVLPFDAHHVLVEDTYFSDTPDLDVHTLRSEILRYAALHGMKVRNVGREEVGVLPLPARSVPPTPADGPLVAGYQGGWFHPTTGYSFPTAVRVAAHLASSPPGRERGQKWDAMLAEQRRQLRFCLILNRLFFGAFAPADRWNVIERFYRLPEDTVRRFYAMQLTASDRARIVCGRPPKGFSLRLALDLGASP